MKETDWIDGKVKPVRVGVYKRDIDGCSYAYWDGRQWSVAMKRPDIAREWAGVLSLNPNLPWKGLAK